MDSLITAAARALSAGWAFEVTRWAGLSPGRGEVANLHVVAMEAGIEHNRAAMACGAMNRAWSKVWKQEQSPLFEGNLGPIGIDGAASERHGRKCAEDKPDTG